MQKLFERIHTLNLITFSNNIREIRINPDQKVYCEIDEYYRKDILKADFNDLVRNISILPTMLYKIRPFHRAIDTESTKHILTLWKIINASHHEHTQMLLSHSPIQKHQALPVCHHFQLALRYPHLLLTNTKDSSQVYAHSLLHIGLHLPDSPPAKTPNTLALPIDRLLQSNLPNAIIAAIVHETPAKIQKLRQNYLLNIEIQRNTGVQYRELLRHRFNRFALFFAVSYYQYLIDHGFSQETAFLNTIDVFAHAPGIACNLSENFNLPINFFYWLKAHKLIALSEVNDCKEVTPEHFPDNLHACFTDKGDKMPRIRCMKPFYPLEYLDIEHQRFLKAINEAIENNHDLNPIFERYCKGAFR